MSAGCRWLGFAWGGTRVSRSNGRGLASRRDADLGTATAQRDRRAGRPMRSPRRIWTAMVGATEFRWSSSNGCAPARARPSAISRSSSAACASRASTEASHGEHPIESIEFLYRTITLGVRDVGNALSGSQDIVTYQIPQHSGG